MDTKTFSEFQKLCNDTIEKFILNNKLRKEPFYIKILDFNQYLNKYNKNIILAELNHLLWCEKVKKNISEFHLAKNKKSNDYFIIVTSKFFTYDENLEFIIN